MKTEINTTVVKFFKAWVAEKNMYVNAEHNPAVPSNIGSSIEPVSGGSHFNSVAAAKRSLQSQVKNGYFVGVAVLNATLLDTQYIGGPEDRKHAVEVYAKY